MASSTLTTESGDILQAETVSGVASASTLNDISVVTIYKETFDTNPTSRDWLVGTDWEWDSVNLRMKIA
jgi:hypothetical protein